MESHDIKNVKIMTIASILTKKFNDTEGNKNDINGRAVITSVTKNSAILNYRHIFYFSEDLGLKCGSTLQYIAHKTSDDSLEIKEILFNGNDVDIYGNGEDKKEEDIEVDVQLVGVVIQRRGRYFVVDSYPNSDLNLDYISSNFIPVIGDKVRLIEGKDDDVDMERDNDLLNSEGRLENKVVLGDTVFRIKEVQPFKLEKLVAHITSYDEDEQIGTINDNITFHKDFCRPGFVPLKGDKVNVTVIESGSQEGRRGRALDVAPTEDTVIKPSITETDDNEILSDIFKNKNHIVVSENLSVNLRKIGDKAMLHVEIKNEGTVPRTIVNVTFVINSNKSQLTLQSPSMDSSIMIRPKQSIHLKISCLASVMGLTKEKLVIQFHGFRIARWINIKVSAVYDKNKIAKKYYQRNEKSLTKSARVSFENCNKVIVVGQRPVKPPSFISNKLPMYEIPDTFATAVFDHMEENSFVGNIDIEKIAPTLKKELTIENYDTFFRILLYLEELALQVNMRRYDMTNAKFEKTNDFLVLEVKDLIERRPSIIIGDKVIASNLREPKALPFEGFVHKTGKHHLYLKFHQNFHSNYNGKEYSVEFHSSRTNFRRYHQAIDLAHKHLGKQFLFPSTIKIKSPQISFYTDDDVFDLFDTVTKKSTATSSSESSMKKSTREKLEWHDENLNHFQKAAVKNILLGVARPLPYFIFGPPGTGKTVTIIETILQIYKMIPESRLLVVAPSNSAADLLALHLIETDTLSPNDLIRIVAFRCVAEGNIPSKLVPYCVTGDLAREGSREVRSSIQNGVNIGVQASVLGKHRITIGTCMVVGVLYTMGFSKGHFSHIIIDEAGQATEPEIMIPLSLLDTATAQTVLAGDPLQLGPCVFSLLSKQYGLGNSFFERLINRFPYARDPLGFPESGGYNACLVTRLIYNYRSLPEILKLTNTLFYNSELQPVVSAESGKEVDLLMKVADILPKRKVKLPPSVIFHGIRGENFQTPDCPSWFNPVEANQVFSYLKNLFSKGISASDIGVITPYIKQGQEVKKLLNEHKLELPKIGSVEEFQGQEFKIVILSTVRSNDTGAKNDAKYGLGFIASPRRLNVAISRAQVLLIIIGNPHLLCTDNYWRSVLKYSVKIGGYIGCDFPNMNN